jgi:diadenylate cyclase
MIFSNVLQFAAAHWKDALEIALLAVALYYTWNFFKGTPGANVLMGLVTIFLGGTLISEFFGLPVIGWIFKTLSAVLILALVVIFQPELRRGLAALGSHRLFFTPTESREELDLLSETTFKLANEKLGALIALERSQALDGFSETGVRLDCALSAELVVTIFFPKTPLHDGGLIVRGDRVAAAACLFPVSQRGDLDRTLGTRHRAALGLCEQCDAIVIVVSEETGIVSICHDREIERGFDPTSFRLRLGELLASKNEKSDPQPLAGEDRLPRPRPGSLGGHQKEHRDHLAF